MRINRREFMSAVAAGTASTWTAGAAAPSGARRPNIVVLFADDLGYADLSCYGDGPTRTPVLDQLAREGARCTDFYAGSAVCSPSRAAMLTGRAAVRTGVYSWIHNEHAMHLRAWELTYGRLLREAGYDTGHFGKWHLGYGIYDGEGEGPMAGQGDARLQGGAPGPNPGDHGFDYWIATGNNAHPSHRNPENFVRNGDAVGKLEGYSSQLMIDEALGWLEKRADSEQPYLLNIWFNEPHPSGGPAAPQEFEERHAGRERPGYHGAVEYMDQNIGRLLNALEARGEADNTLVVFASDNGSYMEGSNVPLQGRKGQLWDGGIRVPAIFRWPGVIPAGQTITAPAGVVDMLPTLCEAVGIAPPADRTLDGTSLLPVLKGGGMERETPLYWFYSPSRPVCAIRDGDWSLVADPTLDLPTHNLFLEESIGDIKATELENFRLYNLREDPGQEEDVSARHPERFATMKAAMHRLHREIIDEAFDWRRAAG